jgi:two-component system chemotaxis response regulator CheB
MPIRVMLVDDSCVVRALLTKALQHESDIHLIVTAENGEEAIALAKEYQPEVIILDIEMPKMDGMMALPFLLNAVPKVKIIMASHLTTRGAEISLTALERGASDYIAKPMMDGLEDFYRDLKAKIRVFSHEVRKPTPVEVSASVALPTALPSFQSVSVANAALSNAKQPIHAIAIAASTGGPQTLVQIVSQLKTQLNHIPIFITQHMPATFTSIFAKHLARESGLPCHEARDKEAVRAGHLYLAPGDYHLRVVREGNHAIMRLSQEEKINFCRPAADPMFTSLSEVYGQHLLGVVLTGMGRDGVDGAKQIVQRGGAVIAQDEASSIVYGMPKAVAESGVCQAIVPLQQIVPYLIARCGRK